MFSPAPRGARRAWLAAALSLALSGCAADPVDWTGERSLTDVPAAAGALRLAPDGSLVPDSMARLAARVPPPAGPICPGSLRLAAGDSGMVFGVWWAPRPDSSARLLAARSADGGASWSAPAPVDTTDRAVSGCRREAPAIAADPRSGYVHVAYPLLAPEGPGLFFSHSMDRGVSFHAPVPILYGERLGATSVAADGDLVVVGFEDPSSHTPRIGLAMSRTMGHIFESRLVPVSDASGVATRPMTALRDHRLAVAWERRATEAGPAALVVRVGVLR